MSDPCAACGPTFLGRCPHFPWMGVKASDAPPVSSPSVNAACVVDLKALVDWAREELTRERNAAVEARYEVSRHRERIVELEARLKIAETERERSRYLLEHAQCDAKEAQQMLAYERGRGRPIIATGPVLTPGTPAAVIEAYRLLCGHEPTWDNRSLWTDIAVCPDGLLDRALGRLISWLDVHAPGGKP